MQGSHIFIIEDDHDVRVMLRIALELEGYVVSSAADGKRGLEMLLNRECTPTLIILDLMMPVMNGWEVLASLKQHPDLQQIPVLVTSAAGNKSKVTDVMAFIPRPINLGTILDMVTEHQLPTNVLKNTTAPEMHPLQ